MAVVTNVEANPLDRSCADSSSATVANATVPSWLTCWAPLGSYGEVTSTTWGSFSMFASIVSIFCCTCGSVTFAPPVVPITICSVSPDCWGATDLIRSSARVDSELGRLKSFEYAVPAALAIPKNATSAMSHAATTMRRCRYDQRASPRMLRSSFRDQTTFKCLNI